MNEQEIRTLLDDLADTPAPPPRVDVPRAVTVARRQARARTWVSTAAASVLVVALAVGVNYAVTGGSPAPVADGPTTGTVASAPGRFDPLIEYARFGWVPDESRMDSGFTSVSGAGFTTVRSRYVPHPDEPMGRLPAEEVSVTVYAAGVKPQSELPLNVWGPPEATLPYAPVSDAPPVNGAPAFWVTVPDEPEQVILKWRYAPNAWAEVTVARTSGDLRESAHRVARELRLGGAERLRFPFHLTGLPAGLRPLASFFAEGGLDGPWRAELALSDSTDDQGLDVRVTARPATGEGNPNTTVDGHDARREAAPKDTDGAHVADAEYVDMLFVYDVSGLQTDVLVEGRTAADAEPLGPDGALGVFRGMTVHPDRSDWTDQPLR